MSFGDDPTQGAAGPGDDPLQGGPIADGSGDPTQGDEFGATAMEDPSQGDEIGEDNSAVSVKGDNKDMDR